MQQKSTSSAGAAPPEQSSAVERWLELGTHRITVWTGTELDVRIPGPDALVRAESLPDDLREAALAALAHPAGYEGVVVDLYKSTDLTTEEGRARMTTALDRGQRLEDVLVAGMVVGVSGEKVTLTPEQARAMPEDDRQLLLELAERKRRTDARGVFLGVMPLEEIEDFRAFHECAEDCAACRAYVGRYSTNALATVLNSV